MHPDTVLARPPVPDADDTALFLDVDGTLLEFAQTPDAVVVSDALRALLTDLESACGGALVLRDTVPGRTLPRSTLPCG